MYVTFMQKVPVLFIRESTHSKTGRKIATLFWRSRAGSRRGQVVSSLPVRGGEPEGGSQSVRQWKWRRRPAQCRKLSLFWIAFNFTEQPQKTRSKKSKTWRGRKTKKKRERKKTRGAPNFCSPLSAENCLPVLTFFFLFFFLCCERKEKSSKAQSWTWEMWSYRLVCFNPRLQDPPLIHAVQCDGTWTWIIIAVKCCDDADCYLYTYI